MSLRLNTLNYTSRYYLVRFLYVLAVSLTKTTFVPFLHERGLSSSEIHFLYAIFSISVMVLEAPTSAIGEWLGPRRSFLIGCLFKVSSAALFFLGNTFNEFVFAEVVSAIATAFITGSLATWIMNRLTEAGEKKNEKETSKVFILGARYSRIALALGGVSGAYIASTSLSFPWLGVGFGFFVTFLLSKTLLSKDGPRKTSHLPKISFKNSIDRIQKGLVTVAKSKVLILVVLESFAVSVALASPKMYWVPYLKEHFGKDMVFIGHMWLLLAGVQLLGTFGIQFLLSKAGSALKLKFMFSIFTTLMMTAVVFSHENALPYIILYLVVEWAKPFHQTLSMTLVQEETQTQGRLTVLSFNSLLSKLGRALGLIMAGSITQFASVTVAWGTGVFLYALILPFFLVVVTKRTK